MTEIHPTAVPNQLAPHELRISPHEDGVEVSVDPARAGWRYLSFRAFRLGAGETLSIGAPGCEAAVVTLAGGVTADVAGAATIELPGRASVFDGLPWACYLPVDRSASLTAIGGSAVIAIAVAPTSGTGRGAADPIRIGPDDVRVEVRGAGNATRQVNHIIAPDFPADRLLVVEVLTPSGNWSSWPPHKHDVDAMPNEAVLEEIYYYQFRRRAAWGVQRLYRPHDSAAGTARDAVWAVRHGDLVLVTDGYHPFVATPADDAYYLNALAGDRRTMACSFDPDLEWVRGAWVEALPDPRVPLVSRSTPRDR